MKFAVIVARPAMFTPRDHKRTSLFIEYYEHAVDAHKAARRERESMKKDSRWPILACKVIGIKSR